MPHQNESTNRRTISVIVPTRNEARNVGYVLERLPSIVDEVVLVDGNSSDGTVDAALAVRPDLVVVMQSRRGKGNALAAGFEACTGDYIVMIDADGSMDPGEIESFVSALDEGADYAKGSRFCVGGGSADITPVRNVGNRCLNGITNVLFGTRYSDLCYGYNAFRRECLQSFSLPPAHDVTSGARWGDGFEIETMINVRVARGRRTIREVPSFESERRFGESNLRTFRDGWRVLGTIMRERLSRTSFAPHASALPSQRAQNLIVLPQHVDNHGASRTSGAA